MQELDIVKLKETYLSIPAGMTGTIVYAYKNMTMFEVEFSVEDVSIVATISSNKLEFI